MAACANAGGRAGIRNPCAERPDLKQRAGKYATARPLHLKGSTQVALQVLVAGALSANTFVTVSEISRRVGIPYQKIFRVFNRLSRAGVVLGVRGRLGGVKLARPPAEIRIGDIVRLFESAAFDGNTATNSEDSKSEDCAMDALVRAAQDAYLSTLNKYSIADVTANNKGRRFAA